MRSVFGEADHAPFGGPRQELVYGRTGDGVLVHISEVASGLVCACACPACERRLVARKGARTAHHFAHYGAGEGCGRAVETNAHIWAKQVLERTKKILLPAIEAEEAGRRIVTRPAGMFQFEDVRLEKRFGDIVPDVIVRAGSRELLVEVFVTHRSDDTKIKKIRASAVSAMEVDLSALRTSQDRNEVAAALLRAAPRVWLYNPLVEATAAKLKAEVDRDKAAAAAALRRRAAMMISEARRPHARPTEELLEDRRRVASLGREEHITWAAPSSEGFTVAPVSWQAAVYARCVIGQATGSPWSRPSFDGHDVIARIADCVIPPFIKRQSRGLNEALRQVDAAFIAPAAVVERYLQWLAERGVLVHDGHGYQVARSEAGDLARRMRRREVTDARRARAAQRASAIVARLPEAEAVSFELNSWMARPLPSLGRSVESMIEGDDQTWWTFESRLDRIDAMQAGWSWTEDFLGLPLQGELERVRQREQAREAAAAERRRQELEAAAQNRLEVATASAVRVLGTGAAEWLGRPGQKRGVCPADAAREGPEGLERVLRALARIEAERQARQARQDARASAQDELRRAAAKVFDAARAEVFLKSAHPGLSGQSPLAYCADPVTLRACVALLPTKRRG